MNRGLRALIAEQSPQIADHRFQYRLGDELVAPNLIQQGFLCQQLARSASQGAEHREWCRRERNGFAIAQQASIRLVELEQVEAHERERFTAPASAGRCIVAFH